MTASEQRVDLDALLAELDAAAIQPGVREDIAVIADEVRALRGELAHARRMHGEALAAHERASQVLDVIAKLPDVYLAQRDRMAASMDPRASGQRSAYEDAANRIRTILNSRKDT